MARSGAVNFFESNQMASRAQLLCAHFAYRVVIVPLVSRAGARWAFCMNSMARTCRVPVSTSLPHVGRDDKDFARRALDHFQGAQDFRKQGNRSCYGDELKRVEVLLREIQRPRRYGGSSAPSLIGVAGRIVARFLALLLL